MMEYNGSRIASQSKQTERGGPKPAKVGLHRRLETTKNLTDSVEWCVGFHCQKAKEQHQDAHGMNGF
jgi:hypothetical protein